jgi:hypothetical protein
LALLETRENAVWHWRRNGAIGSHQAGVDSAAAALFFDFFGASQCNRSSVFFRFVLRLSNIVVGARN